jgi:hypothetical protein
MAKLMNKSNMGKMRVMTDVAGERYWTVIMEMEAPSMQAFESMMSGEGQSAEDSKEFEKIMQGYHDLVDIGRREIYKVEG